MYMDRGIIYSYTVKVTGIVSFFGCQCWHLRFLRCHVLLLYYNITIIYLYLHIISVDCSFKYSLGTQQIFHIILILDILLYPPSKDPASEEKNSVTRLPTVVYILLKVCTVKISFGPTHLIISLGSQCSFLRSPSWKMGFCLIGLLQYIIILILAFILLERTVMSGV